MDMRFFWLVDRVAQLQFTVAHITGVWNIAAHFTKPLPKSKFYQFLPYIIVNMDNETPEPKQRSVTVTFPKDM